MESLDYLSCQRAHRHRYDQVALDTAEVIRKMVEELPHALCKRHEQNGLLILFREISCTVDQDRGFPASRYPSQSSGASKISFGYFLLLWMQEEHPVRHRMV